MQQILEKLVAARIQLLPLTQIERHYVFERDGFISLVEAPDEEIEIEASSEQVELMRSFAQDLRLALEGR
jgi:hypothetical protein